MSHLFVLPQPKSTLCSVSVSESEDTPFPLLPLFFFDDDVEPSNRESFITIDSVTGYHTPTNNFVTLRGIYPHVG